MWIVEKTFAEAIMDVVRPNFKNFSLPKPLRETALHIFSLRSRRQNKAWGGARKRETPGMTGDLSTSPRSGRQRLMRPQIMMQARTTKNCRPHSRA
jgi:hypothetical protein